MYQQNLYVQENAMKQFIDKYDRKIKGVLSGFDRLVMRGTLRVFESGSGGVLAFLSAVGVTLECFGTYMQQLTGRLREASCELANRLGRPVRYLPSSQTRKELIAREIAEQDRVTDGLICILTCVEPCMSYRLFRNSSDGRPFLRKVQRKCLHLYHYWIDPTFGFMSARIQTWFPFPIQVCLNGREWLARQMDLRGMRYRRRENCFVRLADPQGAQSLMDSLLRISWSTALDRVARRLNSAHDTFFDRYPVSYYWVVHESEWATDLMFKSPANLASLYRLWVRGGISAFSSPDIMRFLGKKFHGNFQGAVRSSYRHRMEGIRVKHWMNSNSVKIYNKQPNILRVETTINDPTDFKVYRASSWDPEGPLSWRPMRKGVADMHRRTKVSQNSNGRYLDALASLDTSRPLAELVGPICRGKRWQGRPVRALRPWSSADRTLLRTISRGEFAVNGFRNRDIRDHLFPGNSSSPAERRRASGRVTHRLRLLRAHGIIKKVPQTHRYVLTRPGRQLAVAITQMQDVTLEQLNKTAA